MGEMTSESPYRPQLYETVTEEDRQHLDKYGYSPNPKLNWGETNNPLLGKKYYYMKNTNLMVDDYGKARMEKSANISREEGMKQIASEKFIRESIDKAGSGIYSVENYNKNIIPQLQTFAIRQAPPPPARIEGAQEATADDIINPIKKEENIKTGVRSKAGGAKSLRISIGSTPVSAGIGKV